MDNSSIADNFSLLSKLMDIHGDNSFKAKSYAAAAFTIDKLPAELSELDPEKIFVIRGIGDTIGKKILEQIETGRLLALDEYLAKTPPGIIEMLRIKGLGPKKISTIWKELESENLGELLYACNENRLTLYKGFGEKTQQNIKEAIEFYLGSLGSHLYQQIEPFVESVTRKLTEEFSGQQFIVTGSFRRQMEIIEIPEWVTDLDINELCEFFTHHEYECITGDNGYVTVQGKDNMVLGFFCCEASELYQRLFTTSCSAAFLDAWQEKTGWQPTDIFSSEEDIFKAAGIAFIPAFGREDARVIDAYRTGTPREVIQPGDIRGIIHTHSKWSDGSHTIEQMARSAMAQGYEYLVISDHSRSAFYANGLDEARLEAQHREIDELNRMLTPFRIFKSIESDILNDGNLDYPAEVLARFDLVIASVHSNLKMTEDKAMARLLQAIQNPYTSILGHMTGRLLLSRAGYPVDHQKIIDACAAHQVVIELNAHPRRLDMDWRWIPAALDKGVLISIDPDSHSADSFSDCRFGVLAAQKGGLTRENNLSSFSLPEFEAFLQTQHAKR